MDDAHLVMPVGPPLVFSEYHGLLVRRRPDGAQWLIPVRWVRM